MKRTGMVSLAGVGLLFTSMIFAVLNAGAQATPPQAMGPGGEMRPSMREGGRHEREGGLGMPPGMWWRNPEIAGKLALTADQQKKMDEIFRQSRLQLVDLKASLEKEQINLEPLLNANPPDQGRTLGEISKIADLRADLEKANAKMLLGLRGVLTVDQWTKMQEHHRGERMRRMDGGDGRRGPESGGMPGPPANE